MFAEDSYCANKSGLFYKLVLQRYAAIKLFMECINESYPEMVQIKPIGMSYEGKALNVVHLSMGDHQVVNKDSVFILAGLHGNDWSTIASVF